MVIAVMNNLPELIGMGAWTFIVWVGARRFERWKAS